MEYLFTSESIISFFILVILEVVLGIDNVIFVSLVMNRLPAGDINKARKIWMITGILSRSLLLSGLGWLLSQKGKNVFCIYVAIGQKNSTVAQVVAKLEETGAMEYAGLFCFTEPGHDSLPGRNRH